MTTSVKTCFKCGQEKPLDEFYRHKMMGDGHLNKCKECAKADVAKNREENIDRYRSYDRKRGNRQTKESRENYKRLHPAETKARSAVGNAVRDGRLERQPCEVCGTTEFVHAHHEDYSKPLDVAWLCVVHHHARHAEMKWLDG